MDLYSEKQRSLPQKIFVNLGEVLLLLTSWFILFTPAAAALIPWEIVSYPVYPVRRWVIFLFSIIVFFRMGYMMFFLLRRKFTWSECFIVLSAYALYYIGFAVLVLSVDRPLDYFDYFGIALFVAGSFVNTYSEIARDRWKKKPENKGHLYTEGLFRYSMHINFFGDFLWVSAYAVLTRNFYAALIPAALFCLFVFYNIPALDRYLAAKYGEEFESYAKRTRRFIPFIY